MGRRHFAENDARDFWNDARRSNACRQGDRDYLHDECVICPDYATDNDATFHCCDDYGGANGGSHRLHGMTQNDSRNDHLLPILLVGAGEGLCVNVAREARDVRSHPRRDANVEARVGREVSIHV